MGGTFKDRTWESGELLRVGRLEDLEVILEDASISRRHAEIRATERGWRLRDLGSTNGTRLNGVRIGAGQWPLHLRDIVQLGDVSLFVEHISDGAEEERGDTLRVQGTAASSWDEALQGLAYDSNHCPRPGDQLLALLRAGHHLVHIEKEEELLHSILNDAVSVLDAQRGAIVLLDGASDVLKLRALVAGQGAPAAIVAGNRPGSARFQFSNSLANRSIQSGESILCQQVDQDPELAIAKSIAEGTMASVLCLLLRTPRRRLGVLHLDRGPWQRPFSMDDLHLADALAANVSAGIECAQLMRKQRDLFLDTITILAQAVEMRDEYTGGHTYRVSTYSALLAEQLDFPARDLELIRLGTPLHDIGKIGIDDAILRKPDRLTPQEFEVMKTHTVKGAEIIATIPSLQPIIPIVRSHHERWDGRGYPDGLGGEAISPLARVVALADAFDAMTSDRPYRKGMAPEVAFAEIEKHAGQQFDPTFTGAFLVIRDKILETMQTLQAQRGVTPSSRMIRKLTVPAAIPSVSLATQAQPAPGPRP
jgi:putative nucleotidyltransferase with HDIG domain